MPIFQICYQLLLILRVKEIKSVMLGVTYIIYQRNMGAESADVPGLVMFIRGKDFVQFCWIIFYFPKIKAPLPASTRVEMDFQPIGCILYSLSLERVLPQLV